MAVSLNIKDQRVIKVAIGIVILFAILAVWYTQSYEPNMKIIEEKRGTLEGLNIKLQKAKLDASKLPQIKIEMEEAFIKYKVLEELLPPDRDVAEFLNKINVSARENNVSIKNIEVQASELRPYFVVNPYRVELAGNYHDLGSFFEALANLKFIITEKNLSLKRNTRGKGSVSALLTVTSYHIPVEERLQSPEQALKAQEAAQQDTSKAPGGPPPPTTKPRATTDDAATAISGGVGPAP
jgi:type IV pilus assembly protein PilO